MRDRWTSRTLQERVEQHTIPEPNSGCLLWLASLDGKGYGQINVGGKIRRAHVVSYELILGLVPSGLELDHLCKTPTCVNPYHLEPVTHAENIRRSIVGEINRKRAAAKTHCVNGHPLTEENCYAERWKRGLRQCRLCDALRKARGIKSRSPAVDRLQK